MNIDPLSVACPYCGSPSGERKPMTTPTKEERREAFDALLWLLRQPERWEHATSSHLSIRLIGNTKFRIFIGCGFLSYSIMCMVGKDINFSPLQKWKMRPFVNAIEARLGNVTLEELLT